MKVPQPQYLGLIYFASELLLTLSRRSRGTGARQDRSTLAILWIVILASITAAVCVAIRFPAMRVRHANSFAVAGLVLFVTGLALRWWAIVTLGRYFTVDVQIATDHELVESGPFRVLRHPSYTGVILAFAGFAFSLGNWAAALVLLVPITAAFVHRMNVEEQALAAALGQRYVSYMGRTKRLIPFVY